MNSESKHFNNDYKDNEHCQDEDFVLLKVGFPSAITITSTAVNGNTFNIASLCVNTCDLEDPKIELEFSTNLFIGAVTPSLGATLAFQVNKFLVDPCFPSNSRPVGSPIYFSTITTSIADTVSFFVCDDNDCDECLVRYTVTATVGGLATSATTIGGPFSVNNSTLAAIVVAEGEKCC